MQKNRDFSKVAKQLKQELQKKITQLWQYRTWLTYLLLPLAWLYQTLIIFRRACYRLKLLKATQFPVPVIMVGNITTGGTGKTPLVIALANFLQQQGYKPGIVSRGYGAKAKHYPVAVSKFSLPQEVGDEPLLIARRTGCPVIVDPKRVRAVETLLQQHDCDIVISDDGLQHYALARTLEIAVIDGNKRFGNGYCLPAGPLRESIQRLNNVDFIVNNGKSKPGEYLMRLQVNSLRNLVDETQVKSLDDFYGQTVNAVAGIGNPTRFFQTLRYHGLNIIEQVFPDHYAYQVDDLVFAVERPVIMTEKDAVKCMAFANHLYWYLEVEAQLDNQFWLMLLAKLNEQKVNK